MNVKILSILLLVSCASQKPLPFNFIERTDSNYDLKKLKDQCADIYSRIGDKEDCIKDLSVNQIDKLHELWGILKTPDKNNLKNLLPLDFEVYLNISISSFDKLALKYNTTEAKEVLIWVIENKEIARIFQKEDRNLKTLAVLLRSFMGKFPKAHEPFLKKLGKDRLIERLIDSSNNEFLLNWFHKYTEDHFCNGYSVTPACFSVYCEIGNKINSSYKQNWLNSGTAFKNYIDNIIKQKVNSKNWNIGEKSFESFNLSDITDWTENLCGKILEL